MSVFSSSLTKYLQGPKLRKGELFPQGRLFVETSSIAREAGVLAGTMLASKALSAMSNSRLRCSAAVSKRIVRHSLIGGPRARIPGTRGLRV
eukprot:6292895-Alexandrium_andersonii.AAC.1